MTKLLRSAAVAALSVPSVAFAGSLEAPVETAPVAVAPAAPAAGPIWSGIATLSYGYVDVDFGPDSVDGDRFALDFVGDVAFTDAFSVGLQASLSKLKGFGDDIDSSFLKVAPSYTLNNGLALGAFVETGKTDLGFGGDDDVRLTSYGVTAGYVLGGVAIEGNLGMTDADDLIDGIDVYDFGVNATYAPTEQVIVGGGLAASRLNGEGNATFTAVRVGGAYSISNEMNVFAGVNYADFDDIGDLTTVGLGLGYDMSNLINFPLLASVEYQYRTLDTGLDADLDADVWSFGLSIPFGGAAAIPASSVASQALNPRASVLNDLQLNF